MALPTPIKLTVATVCIALAIGCIAYINQPDSSSASQSTNDAYVQADFSAVGAKISGTITDVLIAENQPVHKGDLLVAIDDKDFVLVPRQR